MALAPYLAMTAAEIAHSSHLPIKPAYLCCPFINGNPNLPEAMPADTLLVLTDQYPADPVIADNLILQILSLEYSAVLLDFQKPDSKDAFAFAQKLLYSLPCPVIVSDLYANELDCPVFLPPVPLHTRLSEHTKPWQGRGIWLDISAEGEKITLTPEGSSISLLSQIQSKETGHPDINLHCHYSISTAENSAAFTLWRTKEDLEDLLAEAESCGIKGAVGLYQELQFFDKTASGQRPEAITSLRSGGRPTP